MRGEYVALNKLRKLFIKEYLVDLNATQAAKRAGYSEKTAEYALGNLKTIVKRRMSSDRGMPA